jgi:diguanylate cyclase (GGDEF)-like protein/PAS domain S-box-containing protein
VAAGASDVKKKRSQNVVAIEEQHNFQKQLDQCGGDFSELLSTYMALERRHESLQESHNKLVEAAQTLGSLGPSRDALCLMADRNGKIRYNSDSARTLLGLEKHNITCLQQLVNPFHLAHLEVMLCKLADEDSSTWSDHSELFLRTEGELGNDRLFGTVTFSLAHGQSALTCWVLRDWSTGAHSANDPKGLARLHHHQHQGFLVTDKHGTILGLDPTFSRVTGYTHADLVGQNTRQLRTGRGQEIMPGSLWAEVKSKGFWQGPVNGNTQNGGLLHQWMTVTAINDHANGASIYLMGFADLALHRAAEKTLFEASQYDGLTGLPSMDLLTEKIGQKIARCWQGGPRVSLLAITLDKLKLFEETHGRYCADVLMQTAVARLQESIRGCDMLARSGPYGFVALLVGPKGPSDVAAVAQRMIRAMTRDIAVHQQNLVLGAHIGSASFPQDGIEVTALVEHAHIAMVLARTGGHNAHVTYNQQMPTQLSVFNQAVQDDFRQAIAKKQLYMVYQAHVSTGSVFNILACEARICWRHPMDSQLDWSAYSAHAGHREAGHEAAVWMINAAGLQLKSWQMQGLPDMNVVLNLTAAQITSTAIADALTDLPGRTGTDPSRLELTITEAESVRISNKALERLLALRRMGVKIGVRDFGSGYASLKVLKMRPFDRIRLEQRFTAEAATPRETDEALAMGVSMDLEYPPFASPQTQATAPRDQADELGEQTTQSYLIGHPMLPEVLMSWALASAAPRRESAPA